jgi:hypothetical protein
MARQLNVECGSAFDALAVSKRRSVSSVLLPSPLTH